MDGIGMPDDGGGHERYTDLVFLGKRLKKDTIIHYTTRTHVRIIQTDRDHNWIQEAVMEYRERIKALVDKVADEAVLRRVWKILERAYNA